MASELLPELHPKVSAAWSPMALWIELHLEFERAFEAGDGQRVSRILKYARWCWHAPSQDTVAAVICAFFEHLPEHEGMRRQIPSWFSRAEFDALREIFQYHAGPELVAGIERQYGR